MAQQSRRTKLEKGNGRAERRGEGNVRRAKGQAVVWVCVLGWRQSFMTKQCACNSTRTNEPHTNSYTHTHTHSLTYTLTRKEERESQEVRKVEHKN